MEQKRKLTGLQLLLTQVLSKVIDSRGSPNFVESRRGSGTEVELISRLQHRLNKLEIKERNSHELYTKIVKIEQLFRALPMSQQSKDLQNMLRNQDSLMAQMHALLKQATEGRTIFHKISVCYQSLSNELSTFTKSSSMLFKHDGPPINISLNTNKPENVNDTCVLHILEEEGNKSFLENEEEKVDYVLPAKADCSELTEPRIDGIYQFIVPELNEVERNFNERYCAFATRGPAWTVIQRRGPYEPQENFNRSWDEYRAGFGDLSRDFWFGNEFIHKISYRDDHVLRIELEDFDGRQVWAEYGLFRLDSESYNYQLLIGRFNGTMPDALENHNQMDFSTYDQRNDHSIDEPCAVRTGSGWWFDSCMEANLNGIYRHKPQGHNFNGFIWSNDYSMKAGRMMLRPRKLQLAATEYSYDDYDTDSF
ncbi:fibrinogen-like protein 1 [Scaptodrosophila lebanonensis]|uniref:Fibrinogen-like protein 1 n=1 Tax=Drosophila lebanonensis TaxID=7225 RepID=A0A6J2TN75_DROLE|nr:fibrinogen-like protein 1 [Scaptodrosophila lebanonensis]